MEKIAFIGGGNMAAAIAGGLIANGTRPDTITIADPNADQRARLQAEHGIAVTAESAMACAGAETVVLAVKPQVIPAVAAEIGGTLDGKLVISIAAGVTITMLEDLFGQVAIARAMPNTPALLGLGATGLFLNNRASADERARARRIIDAFGICVDVTREDLLDAVTAVSGSGPAYVFLLIEEMIRAGIALGLPPEDAKALTVQTALGAATMAAKGEAAPEDLRRRVTSPNGTTHAAITAMQDTGFGAVIEKAMIACRDRAVELGKG
ncbi:pyrroline-5-carboxylate reductase [Mameliella alba]|nr:pyrroline-5-carboxylate reductase [Mameliella alba]MBY6171793.1 pyrroline-5-carboxylate reductase [Mameliella alba]MBY6177018.1 pyrroline-5-carboxylate reductase [Mameliella alba]